MDWIDRELEALPTRPQDRFSIEPEQIRALREDIFPYWPGKNSRRHSPAQVLITRYGDLAQRLAGETSDLVWRSGCSTISGILKSS